MFLSLYINRINPIILSRVERVWPKRERERGEKSFLRQENRTCSSKFAGASSRQLHPRPRSYDSRWIRVEERHLWLSLWSNRRRYWSPNGGRRVVWDARASHQRDTGEEKDVSDQPFVCDQFHTGNRLSFYASYSRNRGVISGFGNRTGP